MAFTKGNWNNNKGGGNRGGFKGRSNDGPPPMKENTGRIFSQKERRGDSSPIFSGTADVDGKLFRVSLFINIPAKDRESGRAQRLAADVSAQLNEILGDSGLYIGAVFQDAAEWEANAEGSRSAKPVVKKSKPAPVVEEDDDEEEEEIEEDDEEEVEEEEEEEVAPVKKATPKKAPARAAVVPAAKSKARK